MSKRTKKARGHKREKRAFGAGLTWVIDNLSQAQSDDLDERYPSDEQLLGFLTDSIDAGLDVKVAYDTYNDAYQASAIGAWEGMDNSGYACSGFSRRSASDALAVVWYKVVIVAEGRLCDIATVRQAEDMRG